MSILKMSIMKLMKKHERLLLPIVLVCLAGLITPTASADMNGYDVSGYQSGDITAAAPADFVVIKATQGLGWSNINYSAQVANADRTGKATGMYHFANGGNAVAEAVAYRSFSKILHLR